MTVGNCYGEIDDVDDDLVTTIRWQYGGVGFGDDFGTNVKWFGPTHWYGLGQGLYWELCVRLECSIMVTMTRYDADDCWW